MPVRAVVEPQLRDLDHLVTPGQYAAPDALLPAGAAPVRGVSRHVAAPFHGAHSSTLTLVLPSDDVNVWQLVQV